MCPNFFGTDFILFPETVYINNIQKEKIPNGNSKKEEFFKLYTFYMTIINLYFAEFHDLRLTDV